MFNHVVSKQVPLLKGVPDGKDQHSEQREGTTCNSLLTTHYAHYCISLVQSLLSLSGLFQPQLAKTVASLSELRFQRLPHSPDRFSHTGHPCGLHQAHLSSAMLCPGAVSCPFIMLSLLQIRVTDQWTWLCLLHNEHHLTPSRFLCDLLLSDLVGKTPETYFSVWTEGIMCPWGGPHGLICSQLPVCLHHGSDYN